MSCRCGNKIQNFGPPLFKQIKFRTQFSTRKAQNIFIASVRLSVRLSETKIWSFENKSGPEKLSSAPRSTSSILEPTGCASRQRFQERSTVPFQIIAQLLLPSYLSCSKNQRRWQQSDASNDNVLSKTIQNLTFTSHP